MFNLVKNDIFKFIAIFITIYIAIYVIYIYSCWCEEEKIKKFEEIYKYYSKTDFYLEVYFIVLKYNPTYKMKRDYNAFNEAKKIYNENQEFRIECYKLGIKPKLLEFISKIE
jgi:hypothetical protein